MTSRWCLDGLKGIKITTVQEILQNYEVPSGKTYNAAGIPTPLLMGWASPVDWLITPPFFFFLFFLRKRKKPNRLVTKGLSLWKGVKMWALQSIFSITACLIQKNQTKIRMRHFHENFIHKSFFLMLIYLYRCVLLCSISQYKHILEYLIIILMVCSTWDSLILLLGKRGGFHDCLEIPLSIKKTPKTENAFLHSKMDFIMLNYKLLSEKHVQLHPCQFQRLEKII